MGLVSAKEMARFLKVEKFGFVGVFVGDIILRITRISKLNAIYIANKHLKDAAFFNSLIRDFNIEFEVSKEDLKRIPKEGSFITVSNHPLGGIDGILLLKILTENRPDYKIIANFLLHKIEPMQSYVLPVNPFDTHKDVKSSVAGIKAALKHVSEGFPLGIFPAGEVSTILKDGICLDKEWEPGAIRLIQKAKVPVVPIYFHAKNSRWFYRLAKISGLLRTAKLPSELAKPQKKIIQIRIGKPISVEKQNSYTTIKELGDFLRQKTYLFSKTIPITKKKFLQKKPKKIIGKIETEILKVEIESLRNSENKLFQTENYEMFLSKAEKIPNLLKEIGRLREKTFREVGEGTNLALDLDEYDQYYHHLFLWDPKNDLLVGAYRMGLGAEIVPQRGIEGFYLNSFFGFDASLHEMMRTTIEMGRAFVEKEYQQKPMPLFLLWRGVVQTALQHSEHKYLIGSVSISNHFSAFSRSILVDFLLSHYQDKTLSKHLNTKKEFKIQLTAADKEFILQTVGDDINLLDKLISELEPGKMRMPVLIKKYIQQNVKVLTFTVDPDFNNSLDGLMYVKLTDLPEQILSLAKEEIH